MVLCAVARCLCAYNQLCGAIHIFHCHSLHIQLSAATSSIRLATWDNSNGKIRNVVIKSMKIDWNIMDNIASNLTKAKD